ADRVPIHGSAPVSGGQDSSDSYVEQAVSWTSRNLMPVALVAIAAVGGLIMLFGFTRGRSVAAGAGGATALYDDAVPYDRTARAANGATATRAGDTVILTPELDARPPDKIYAWLQFLDADSKRVPIGSTNVRIGRSKDNDIILQNKTVHRNH